MEITKENVASYVQGSVFFGTGGGLTPDLHQKIFQNILAQASSISAQSLENFPDEAVLVSAYGVGDSSKIPNNFVSKAQEAFMKYKKMTGVDVAGIIPGEIGAEGLAFQLGIGVNLPVVDADLVGGRAAPEIQLDMFSVFDLSITPVLLYAMNDKSIFLEGAFDAQELEITARNFFAHNGESGLLIGYGMTVDEYKKYAMQRTLSRALQIGELLVNNNIDELINSTGGKIIGKCKVLSVNLASEKGFLKGEIVLEIGVVKVKNENIAFVDKKGLLIEAPDSLMLVDDRGNPIHNAQINKMVGQRVILVHLPAQGYWKSEKSKKLWKTVLN
jgi:DUF917 family protein